MPNALAAEAIACRDGAGMARDWEIQNVIVKTDGQLLVDRHRRRHRGV